jgi:transcriptional regulator with XRE-family HTH domain
MTREIENKKIGTNIVIIRKRLGLKQHELASVLEVTNNTMGRYERGEAEISAALLKVLSNKTKVPVNFFYVGVPDRIHLKRYVDSLN